MIGGARTACEGSIACILPLGDPRLRVVSDPVEDVREAGFLEENRRLKAALDAFRAERGFGRGIAAPQIGIPRRFIAVNLGQGTRSLINPRLLWQAPETFTLWDDCMSFPDLLVKVRRHCSISVSFQDDDGKLRVWERLGPAESELLQHELDHLDGILATDRVLDSHGLILRAAFEADPGHFRSQVDYVIQPAP